MPSSTKRRITLSSVAVELTCGSCKRLKLSSIFSPSASKRLFYSRSSSSSAKTTATSRSSTTGGIYESSGSPLSAFGRLGSNSVAVEKESWDPYYDFKQSMLQMIMEKQIFSALDLKDLLNCFMQLNSPSYHGVIVRAFADICNSTFTPSS